MPYKVTYTEHPVGVTTAFYGVVTDDDIVQSCLERTASDDLIKDLTYILDDFVDVTEFKVTPKTVETAAEFAVKASQLNKKPAYLSIMPTDLLYGMSRMWQAYTDETEWKRDIVRTREEAEKWLEANVFEPWLMTKQSPANQGT